MELDQLISKCVNGHAAAEKELFQRYAKRVFTLCLRYTRRREEAYDLMQECFIRLFDALDRFDTQKGEFEAWMYRLSTNVVLQKIRKDKKSVSLLYTNELPEPDDYFIQESFAEISNEILLTCIQNLPEGYQEILNMHVFEGLKHTEIAKVLGISASTSRSQYTRAKKILKNMLQEKIASKHTKNEKRVV